MKNIVGMIKPETNWAPKLALYNVLLRSANTASTSRCRPNTLTSDCPVKASSMCPFSSPVDFHCWMKSFCARLPITLSPESTTGIVTNAISASTGETTNIITVTPITVSSEVSNWLSVCCSAWEMLSMSLVTRLKQLRHESACRSSSAAAC
jgi:hypothetical protein